MLMMGTSIGDGPSSQKVVSRATIPHHLQTPNCYQATGQSLTKPSSMSSRQRKIQKTNQIPLKAVHLFHSPTRHIVPLPLAVPLRSSAARHIHVKPSPARRSYITYRSSLFLCFHQGPHSKPLPLRKEKSQKKRETRRYPNWPLEGANLMHQLCKCRKMMKGEERRQACHKGSAWHDRVQGIQRQRTWVGAGRISAFAASSLFLSCLFH
ncbi:hypothetical protein HDV57DRAFT_393204 [Trichoderma longibrachiatum]|uniref:Uncharacterized protein n=1 Tax=Trichoderma longibrachiatum ATCC 18648 TaxID=983965 RepID=A0A2T4C3K9_TRILO|nr:hypothetical protein M440DRAFT_1246105 [Trichoderma longibrachiatum ATCC 18648]